MTPPRPESDRIIAARLRGTVGRWIHWTRPEGEERDRIIAALQEIATVPQPHRSPILRTDLLAETAGLILGGATGSSDILREQARLRHDVLVDAGADLAEVARWVEIGRERASRSGPPLSGPPLPGARRTRRG